MAGTTNANADEKGGAANSNLQNAHYSAVPSPDEGEPQERVTVLRPTFIRGVARTVSHRGLRGTVGLAARMCLWHGCRRLRRRFHAVRIHGFKMILDLDDPGLSRELFVYRDRERALYRILSEFLNPGMRILDIGGNIGYYPLIEAFAVGEAGSVHVLEPLPSNFALLARNIRLNRVEQRVKLHRLAASDSAGTCRFYVSKASNLGTLHPGTSDTGVAPDLTGETINVTTIELTSFLTLVEAIDVIRMDPEGAEVGIIRGLVPAIKAGQFTGRIVTEIHSSRYDAVTNDMGEMLRELYDCGYVAETVSSDDERSSFLQNVGYTPVERVRESNLRYRGLYKGVGLEHLIEAVRTGGAVRDLVLRKGNA